MPRDKQLLTELTWPEAYERIEKSDTAFFPVGPQEGHGRYLPMGTDINIATAAGVLAAKKAGGVVLHPLAYNFAGATNAYRGTVSIPMSLESELIKAVLRNLWQQRFRAIFVLSIHGPNDAPIAVAIRDLFESERIVASYFNPYTSADRAKYGLPDHAAMEAAMCYAAMDVLGLKDHIPDMASIMEEASPPLDAPGFTEGKLTTGIHYTDIRHHMPGRKVDIAAGRKMLEDAAGELAGKVKHLKDYAAFIEKGGDPPYSAVP